MNEDAQRAYARVSFLVRLAERERAPRERYVRFAEMLQQGIDKWPLAEVTPEALDQLGFLLWARLGDPSGAVRAYARLLELHPLSPFAEPAVSNLRHLCHRMARDPTRAERILRAYSQTVAALLGAQPRPDQQAPALFLSALVAHLLGEEGAAAKLTEVGKRFPGTEWAVKAERLVSLEGLDFAARLRTFERTTYYCDERDLGPETPLVKEWGRQVQVQPITESPVLLDYNLTLSTALPAGQADPETPIGEKDGRWSATWRTSERLSLQHCGAAAFANYELSGSSKHRGTDVVVRRRSERLPNGRQRISLYVQAPVPVYMDVMMGYGAKAVVETASPKPHPASSATGLFYWGGPGRNHGVDCRTGRTFAFEVEVLPGIDTFYPQVVVGTWEVISGDGGAVTPESCGMMPSVPAASASAPMLAGPSGSTLRFQFADADAVFSSPAKCRIVRADHNLRCWYALRSVIERTDEQRRNAGGEARAGGGG
jgi:hypothetical protein